MLRPHLVVPASWLRSRESGKTSLVTLLLLTERKETEWLVASTRVPKREPFSWEASLPAPSEDNSLITRNPKKLSKSLKENPTSPSADSVSRHDCSYLNTYIFHILANLFTFTWKTTAILYLLSKCHVETYHLINSSMLMSSIVLL